MEPKKEQSVQHANTSALSLQLRVAYPLKKTDGYKDAAAAFS
jgi:hypothetical protein